MPGQLDICIKKAKTNKNLDPYFKKKLTLNGT